MFVWLLPEKWHGSIASRAWTPTRRHFNSIDAIWSFIACQRKANFKNVSGQRTSKLQLYIFFKINWRNFSIWLMAEKPKFLRIIRRLYYLILKRNNYLLHWNFDWKSCFAFTSETSEKIHDTTFLVKISVLNIIFSNKMEKWPRYYTYFSIEFGKRNFYITTYLGNYPAAKTHQETSQEKRFQQRSVWRNGGQKVCCRLHNGSRNVKRFRFGHHHWCRCRRVDDDGLLHYR